MKPAAISPHALRSPAKLIALILILAVCLSAFPGVGRAAPNQATCAKSYTVKAGDTLTSIANQYGVTIQAIADLNNLKPPYLIVIGQVLCLPANAKTPTSSETSKSKPTYDVTLKQIGSRIQVKVSGFPAKSNYRVRLGASLRFRDEFVIVGKIRTNNSGAGEAFYRFPNDLQNRPYFYICFKNMATDSLHCKKVSLATAK